MGDSTSSDAPLRASSSSSSYGHSSLSVRDEDDVDQLLCDSAVESGEESSDDTSEGELPSRHNDRRKSVARGGIWANLIRKSVRDVVVLMIGLVLFLAVYEGLIVPLVLSRGAIYRTPVVAQAPNLSSSAAAIAAATASLEVALASSSLAAHTPVGTASACTPVVAAEGAATPIEAVAATSALPYSSRLRLYFMDGAEEEPVRLTPLPDTGRYIYPSIAGQFNNHRQGLSIAVLFAMILGRTVILPKNIPTASIPTRLNEVLDVPSLARLVPLISEEAYEKKMGPLNQQANGDPGLRKRLQEYDLKWAEWRDIYYLSKASYDSDPAQQEYIKNHGQQKTLRFVLDEWDANQDAHDAIRVAHGPPWNFWRQDVAFPNNVMEDFERRFGRHMHFRLDLWQRAGVTLDWLASLRGGNATSDSENTFGAIHWRQNDHPMHLRVHPDKVRAAAASWNISPGGVIYIATDEPKGEWTQSFVRDMRERSITVVTFDDSPLAALAEVDHIGNTYTAFIEQIILAHATHFVWSPQSTYSGFVIRMRQWMKNPNAAEEAKSFYKNRGYDANPALGVRPPTKDQPDFDLFKERK